VPIKLDHVGLNTLVSEPVSSSTNTIGYPLAMTASAYIQAVKINDTGDTISIPQDDHLAAINTHRNGPYGWPAFKSTRIGQNPLTRYQNKNSIFSYIIDGDMRTVTQNGKLRDRFRERRGALKQITESPIYSNHKPLKLLAIAEGEEVEVLVSPGNETQYFGDEQTNRDHNTFDKLPNEFGEMLALYKTKKPERSPIDAVVKLDYSQTIFPKSENSGLHKVRQRDAFVNDFWRDDIDDRSATRNHLTSTNFKFPNISLWPLDTNEDGDTMSLLDSWNDIIPITASGGVIDSSDIGEGTKIGHGILQTELSYISFYNATVPTPTYQNLAANFQVPSASFNPFFKQQPNYSTEIAFVKGTPYQTNTMSGKKPFYDSYDEYSEELRSIAKDYSVIPEFTISNHVAEILKHGPDIKKYATSLFQITGSTIKDSSGADFFKIYSNSDFLKNFDIVQEENFDVVKPKEISLRCKAIKKLLPYKSFYPVMRTLDIAKTFVDSYKQNFFNTYKSSLGAQYVANLEVSGAISNAFNHLFSPGLLYNTIKSGLGVDMPLIKSSTEDDPFGTYDGLASTTIEKGYKYKHLDNDRFLDKLSGSAGLFNAYAESRLPFEALLRPTEILNSFELSLQDQNSTSHIGTTLTRQKESRNYSSLVNNFLAETADFFLENENFTTIASIPQGDPNFGNAEAGRRYKMRLKMYRSTDGSKNTINHNPDNNNYQTTVGNYFYPQDSGSIKENFTMYSNPYGFGGPLVQQPISWDSIDFNQWESFQKSDLKEIYNPGTYSWTSATSSGTQFIPCGSGSYIPVGNNPFIGYNFPYTPPYYHGEAWADFTFLATETKKYSLPEILNSVSVEFLRHYDPHGLYRREEDFNASSLIIEVLNANRMTGSLLTTDGGSLHNIHRLNITIAGGFIDDSIINNFIANGEDPIPTALVSLKFFDSTEYGSVSFTSGSIPQGGQPVILVGSSNSNTTLAENIKKAINGQSNTNVIYPNNASCLHQGIPGLTATRSSNKVIITADKFAYSNDFNNLLGPFSSRLTNRDFVKVEGFYSTDTQYTTNTGIFSVIGTQVGSPLTLTSSIRFNHHLVNEGAMQLPSTTNILSKGILDGFGDLSSDISDNYRWIIQNKFETPMLNFNHIEFSDVNNIEDSNRKSIGMWHQYGLIPDDDKGVYLKIEDVPNSWIKNVLNGKPSLTGSLAKLCGFTNQPVKVGELKDSKVIKEAVVAVPFVERAGERKFFKLDRKDIKAALKEETGLIGQSVIDQIQRMQEYVFPPSMDFLKNKDIDPFAMYIFEFTHTLLKQDLADIWQGLLPDIGRNHETAEATISHELLAHELLGSGAKYLPNQDGKFVGLDRNAREPFIEPDIQWMVFKVKKRAASNYFEKIFERNESNLGDKTRLDEVSATSTGANLGVQYNWPYDFFSLVELVKIDAEVEFANATTTDEGTRIEPVKLKKE
jgi:hypothetical protein